MSIPASIRHTTLYWMLQVTGWGLWCVTGVLMMSAQFGRITAEMLWGYALFFCYSIALTHALRHLIRRRGWLQFPPGRASLRLAPAAAGLGAMLTLCVVLVSFMQSGADTDFRLPAALFGLFANLTFGAGMWTLLYASLSTWLRQREARERADVLERSLGAARLKALEAQISPHFLFNCLNSLRGMIAEDPPRAQDMVTRLANILRHNLVLGTAATTEPLATQVEVVTDYLELESVRFDERLRTHIAIAPDTRDCELPAMLLQTLVENAIKHGIAHLPDGGEVRIASRRVDGMLELVVENSGTLRPAPADSTRVGLANAQERLRMLHGSAASLELTAPAPDRVQARVRLPLLPTRT